jgi:hypothetical protein
MKGFPQFLATKQDYLNCLEMYPEETKGALRRLLADRFMWKNTGEIESEKKGKVDETHRIIPQTRVNEETGKTEEYFLQQERKEDSNARLFILGFTVKEIEKLL